jgi:hypothetical protein
MDKYNTKEIEKISRSYNDLSKESKEIFLYTICASDPQLAVNSLLDSVVIYFKRNELNYEENINKFINNIHVIADIKNKDLEEALKNDKSE